VRAQAARLIMPSTAPAASTTGMPLIFLLTSSCGGDAESKGIGQKRQQSGLDVSASLRRRARRRQRATRARPAGCARFRGAEARRSAGARAGSRPEAASPRLQKAPRHTGSCAAAPLREGRASSTSYTLAVGSTVTGRGVMTSDISTSPSEIATEGATASSVAHAPPAAPRRRGGAADGAARRAAAAARAAVRQRARGAGGGGGGGAAAAGAKRCVRDEAAAPRAQRGAHALGGCSSIVSARSLPRRLVAEASKGRCVVDSAASGARPNAPGSDWLRGFRRICWFGFDARAVLVIRCWCPHGARYWVVRAGAGRERAAGRSRRCMPAAACSAAARCRARSASRRAAGARRRPRRVPS
jgi:hypothetical protein